MHELDCWEIFKLNIIKIAYDLYTTICAALNATKNVGYRESFFSFGNLNKFEAVIF